ncbi:MAG: hypothetical protein HY720_24610, partial [Planctomycetes bacterium]|nr:hypothetical protein [Planctomycetota bacterium]
MIRHLSSSAACLAVLVTALPALLADDEPPTAELLEKLGSDDLAVAHEAATKLGARGEAARLALEDLLAPELKSQEIDREKLAALIEH